MSWLKVTVEFLFRTTQLDLFGYDVPQTPLTPPPSTEHRPLVASNDFVPSIVCEYPELQAKGWELCNTEHSRDCWIRDPAASQPIFTQFDVRTNYEEDMPKGVQREYWLEISGNDEVSPDGFPKLNGKYINGTYPGPVLEACWGDQIIVHVTNRQVDNGTTIHWHGLRQFRSNEMDGVNGVTQCPIAPDDSFTYNFTAAQYGHTWYHSHYSLQYPDGVAGPLVIYGPSSADWQVDLGPVMIADWIHNSADLAYEAEMNGVPPISDSIVVNGRGHYNGNQDKGSYYETVVTPGKTHRLKLINGSVATSFVFSIDGHNMTIIGNDLVPIQPFSVESVVIGIGQRYDVIIEANQDHQDYWIRTVPATDCSGFSADNPPDNRTGILRYDGASTALPTTSRQIGLDDDCRDISPTLLNPIVPWLVDVDPCPSAYQSYKTHLETTQPQGTRVRYNPIPRANMHQMHPQNNVTKDTYHIQLQNETDDILGPPGFPYKHWFVGEQPMWLDFGKPTILNVNESITNPNYTVIPEEFDHGYIYLIVDASRSFPVTHPIHLHGSDFVILAQSDTAWDEQTSPGLFNYDNPPRRDTAILRRAGFVAIAFRPDNPGAWLLHCHIAWHASSGLALQILVRPRNMPEFNGALDDTRRVCDNWEDSLLADALTQIDSGI